MLCYQKISTEYPQNSIHEAIQKTASIPIEKIQGSKAKIDSNHLLQLSVPATIRWN